MIRAAPGRGAVEARQPGAHDQLTADGTRERSIQTRSTKTRNAQAGGPARFAFLFVLMFHRSFGEVGRERLMTPQTDRYQDRFF